MLKGVKIRIYPNKDINAATNILNKGLEIKYEKLVS
jgi:hypothetical protein